MDVYCVCMYIYVLSMYVCTVLYSIIILYHTMVCVHAVVLWVWVYYSDKQSTLVHESCLGDGSMCSCLVYLGDEHL